MENGNSDRNDNPDAAEVACQLAAAISRNGTEYALGGAIALGFWGAPRGTIDVDLTLYLSPDKPSQCIWILQEIGCDVSAAEATENLNEHGFCRASFRGLRVDVFLPTLPFYEKARDRRARVELNGVPVTIWDAESLAVFKMMFFRRKDVADVEQILRTQGPELDRQWIREQLLEIYGRRDPRITQWNELDEEIAR